MYQTKNLMKHCGVMLQTNTFSKLLFQKNKKKIKNKQNKQQLVFSFFAFLSQQHEDQDQQRIFFLCANTTRHSHVSIYGPLAVTICNHVPNAMKSSSIQSTAGDQQATKFNGLPVLPLLLLFVLPSA